MRTDGSVSELEAPQRLAVQRVSDGWKQKDVAAFLGVSLRAIGDWVSAYRASGHDSLKGRSHPGPRPELPARQERSVLSWLARRPRAFGYKTEL